MENSRFLVIGTSNDARCMRHVTTMSAIFARSGRSQVAYIDYARVHIPPAMTPRALPALVRLRVSDNALVDRCDGWNNDIWRNMITQGVVQTLR